MTMCFLVLDAGTGAGRAVIINQHGEILSSAYSEWSYQVDADVPGGATFDPQELEDVLLNVAAQAITTSEVDPRIIRGISSTCLREGTVFIDRDGVELYIGPNFDERATVEGEALVKELGQQLYFTSGTYPPAFGYPARLRWFQTHRPDVYEDIHKVLTLGDWITWKFCGEMTSEASLGCASGVFDVAYRHWSWSLIERLGLNTSWFPPVYQAGERAGVLRGDFASRLGLPRDTPVVVGGGDTQCSLLGMGLYRPLYAGCVAGTTSPVQLLTDRPIFDQSKRTWTNCHLIPGVWCLESNAIVTGLAYRWVRDSLAQGQSYENLNGLIEDTPLGSHGTMAFLGSEIMDMSTYRASWAGGFLFPVPPGPIGLGDLARAVIESNAYAVRGNVEQIMEISARPIRELHISGGQIASTVGMQILADVLDMTLFVHNQQSSSIGAAMCAAVGAGIYNTLQEAVENMVSHPHKLEPVSENAQAYQDYYARWRSYYRQIRNLSEEV